MSRIQMRRLGYAAIKASAQWFLFALVLFCLARSERFASLVQKSSLGQDFLEALYVSAALALSTGYIVFVPLVTYLVTYRMSWGKRVSTDVSIYLLHVAVSVFLFTEDAADIFGAVELFLIASGIFVVLLSERLSWSLSRLFKEVRG